MDVHDIVDKLGIWFPKGSPDECRRAAATYRQMAAALDSAQTGCQASVGSVHACSSGPPFDAFDARWAKWQGSQGYFDVTKQCCLGMADALEKYAKAMDDAVAKLLELVAIAATVLVGGVVLTIFTAGLSDAAAGAAVAAIVGEAAVEAGTMAAVIADMTATVFFGAFFGFLEGLVIDGAVQLEHIEVFHDQKSWNWGEFWQSGGMGAAGGAIGGGMGAGLTRMGGRFAPGLLTGTGWGSRGARALMGAGVGGGTSTIIDLAFTGSVNPLDVVIGTFGGAAGGGAARGRAQTDPGSDVRLMAGGRRGVPFDSTVPSDPVTDLPTAAAANMTARSRADLYNRVAGQAARSYLDGVSPRDGGPVKSVVTGTTTGAPKFNAQGHFDPETGQIAYRRDVTAAIDAAVAAKANGQTLSQNQVERLKDALRTVLHENLHGTYPDNSPHSPGDDPALLRHFETYRMRSAQILEEAFKDWVAQAKVNQFAHDIGLDQPGSLPACTAPAWRRATRPRWRWSGRSPRTAATGCSGSTIRRTSATRRPSRTT